MGPVCSSRLCVQISKSPAEVWEAIADYSFDRQWRKGLLEMTPDPPGGPAVGTKVHAVFTYAIELEPKGGMRLLRPLLGPMVRSGLKKDLQKLKALLEQER